MGYIISIEGDKTCEVLNFLGVLRIIEVDDCLNLLGVGRSSRSHYQVSKNSKTSVVEVALFEGETEACNPGTIHHLFVSDHMRGRVLGVDENIILILVNVLVHISEVMCHHSGEHHRTVLAPLGNDKPLQKVVERLKCSFMAVTLS